MTVKDCDRTRPLAILCGAGAFPLEVAADARRAGRAPFLIGVVGSSEAEIEAYPHVSFGSVRSESSLPF